ncbi:hypothetical protein ACH5RR_037010 [Cinchona calisaya]|uniref:Chromo domain-containing protein n=1 Tax=Cinchona calisaya TaxID=153742 RepID=A0ABD2Y6A2_9GENT
MEQSKKNRRIDYLIHWNGEMEADATWEYDVTLWQFEDQIAAYWEVQKLRNERFLRLDPGNIVWDQRETVELRCYKFVQLTTFESYTILPPNSIEEWNRLEDAFHQQFYRCQPEVRFTDLVQIVQRARKMASQYVEKFKTARMRCNARVPEEKSIAIALVGI